MEGRLDFIEELAAHAVREHDDSLAPRGPHVEAGDEPLVASAVREVHVGAITVECDAQSPALAARGLLTGAG